MDASLRELERAWQREPGDLVAHMAYRARACQLGLHDWRNDRLCAWCNRQEPGLKLWDALKAAGGHGARGFAWGRQLGIAEGTFKGLPSVTRRQPGLRITLYHLTKDQRDGKTHEGRLAHRIPLEPLPTQVIPGVPGRDQGPGLPAAIDSRRGLWLGGVSGQKWPLKNGKAIAEIALLTWYPNHAGWTCDGTRSARPYAMHCLWCNGYSHGDSHGHTPYVTTACAKLTEEQLAINTAAAREHREYEASAAARRAEWELERLTDPTRG